jgi:hypothetical protein
MIKAEILACHVQCVRERGGLEDGGLKPSHRCSYVRHG